MQKQLRHLLIQRLWQTYRDQSIQLQQIEHAFRQIGIEKFYLDHFAIIDLPGPYSGIPALADIFTLLGFKVRGRDYLPEKQNDFTWLAEENAEELLAIESLPQVVIADFRLTEIPKPIQSIVKKYAGQSKPFFLEDNLAVPKKIEKLLIYFKGRDWPLPTVSEFQTVREFNELLAWVLVFGRKPNHFTLSIHLLDQFADLAEFNYFLEKNTTLSLNTEGGVIKGGAHLGVAQSATVGEKNEVQLADGKVIIPIHFVEFIWRCPQKTFSYPLLWRDLNNGFIANQAAHIIKALLPASV